MKNVIIFLVKLYKRFISPIFPNTCRFYPTCSEYMIEAIEKYGIFKGVGMGMWRILRCNPFSKGGFDYVP